MLKIINDLEMFFEDNYQRIHVREYAKKRKISAPTASKLLKQYKQEGLLEKEQEYNRDFYFSNKENKTFIDLSRIYWRTKIQKITEKIENEYINPVIILFGSTAKAEVHPESDIDIAIFSPTKKELDTKDFKMKRKIQIFLFKSKEDVKNKELLNSILNGYKIRGNW